MKQLLILITAFSWALCVSAQEKGKVKTVEATYLYEIPSNVSYAQACQIALAKAQNAAIEEAFGSINSSNNIVVINNDNSDSKTSFHSETSNQVKGVWLGDISEPKYERVLYEGRDLLKVSVKGKARELVAAGVEFEALPLRRHPEKGDAADTFKSGDDFYLYFRSPTDGYLTVFMYNILDNEVLYLLPYQSSGQGSFPITHDKEYYLFSEAKATPEGGAVDELAITCAEGRNEEYNDIYVIFSPNSYAKTSAKVGQQKLTDELIIPSSLSYKDFNSWLTKYQQKDEQMQVRRIPIRIENN